ncbi:unnamed protein product, partial [Cladocopium goreaui]
EDLESIEDEGLTGAEARKKRKQRLEAREAARLQRLAQKAAARRSGSFVDESAEESRARKIAEKATARRAKLQAKATNGGEGEMSPKEEEPKDLKEPREAEAKAPEAEKDEKPKDPKDPKEDVAEEGPEEGELSPQMVAFSENGREVDKKSLRSDKNHKDLANGVEKKKNSEENAEDKTTKQDDGKASRRHGDRRTSPRNRRRHGEDRENRKRRRSSRSSRRDRREREPHRRHLRHDRDADVDKDGKGKKNGRAARSRSAKHKRRGDNAISPARPAKGTAENEDKGKKNGRAARSRSAKHKRRGDNAISPARPAKERLAVGARVRVTVENEDKEGLYFDDDRVGIKGMTGEITEDDKSEQPFRVKLKNGKLSWFKEAWLEDRSSSSSSSSSSSDSSSEEAEEVAEGQSPEEEVPAFAWERTPKNLPAAGMAAYAMNGAGNVSPIAQEVEAFLTCAGVDGEAAQRLRVMPAHQQRLVMNRGPIGGTRAPSAVLISRIRDAELGRTGPPGSGNIPANGGAPSSNPEIEKLISKWNLDAKASFMLRSLPNDKHDLVLKISFEKARNPSAYVITQMNSLFGGMQGIQELQKMQQVANGNRDVMQSNPFNKQNFNLTAVTI